jgi:hypothetical protein
MTKQKDKAQKATATPKVSNEVEEVRKAPEEEVAATMASAITDAASAPAPNVVDAAFSHLEEFERLKAEAIATLLAKKAEIEEKLERLGHKEEQQEEFITRARYVAQRQQQQSGSSGPAAVRQGGYDPAKRCRICGEIGHDARKHRYESKGTTGASVAPTASAAAPSPPARREEEPSS